MKILLLWVCQFSLSAYATMGRLIVVEGFLVKMDKTIAVIKDNKGTMNVPLHSVDAKHVSDGQWIQVSVDLVEFYKLNPKKFPAPATN